MAVLPMIMTISTDLAISNSMSSLVPKYWLNWQILVAIFNEFRGQRLYIFVHPCIARQTFCSINILNPGYTIPCHNLFIHHEFYNKKKRQITKRRFKIYNPA